MNKAITLFLKAQESEQGEISLPIMLHLCSCEQCGKKILVQMTLFGTPHHTAVVAICSDCLLAIPTAEFAKEFPEETKMLEEWKAGPLMAMRRT